MSELLYRWASELGARYAVPIYFGTLREAQEIRRQSKRLLRGLPGQDSMRIEERRDGEWVPADE